LRAFLRVTPVTRSRFEFYERLRKNKRRPVHRHLPFAATLARAIPCFAVWWRKRLELAERPYQLLDMHNGHVCYINEDDARGLLKDGHAKSFGTKRKIHGLRLIVPLSKVTGNAQSQRALTAASYTGTRFIFKQKIRTVSNGTQSVFRLKPVHVTESPEWALKRILTAPALETDVHQLFYTCSLEERASNPGRLRRESVSEIFRLCSGVKRSRARSAGRSGEARPPIPRSLVAAISEASKRRTNLASRCADGAIETRPTHTTTFVLSVDGRNCAASTSQG
jgi:hypothetical protein